MSSFALAVDYGTSNTVAFLRWPDGRTRPLLFEDTPLLPSAVYLEDDGRLLTGRDAVRSARFDPTRFEANPKRHIDERDLLLGRQAVPVEDLIAATLRTVWQEAGRTAETPPTEVTLTHPAAWAQPRQTLLRRAADRAGLPTPRLVPEPVAAATYFASVLGNQVASGASVAVYDLGAGTFDVSVVRRDANGFTPVIIDGFDGVGGLDLDAVVVELVRAGLPAAYEPLWRALHAPGSVAEQRSLRELWDGAREAKQALSRRPTAMVQVPGVAEPQRVTRTEFEAAATPILTGTVHRTVHAIRSASAAPVGLFLVGGSTRVPLVASMLHRATGMPPAVLEQPELVVAEGALHVTAAGTAHAGTAHAADEAPAATVPPLPPPPPPVPVPGPRAAAAPDDRADVQPVPAAAPPPASGRRRRTTLLIALLAIAAVTAGVVLWRVLPDGGDPNGDRNVQSGQSQAPMAAVGSTYGGVTASVTPTPTSAATTTRATTVTPTRTRPVGPAVVTPKLTIVRSTYNGTCPPPRNIPIELYGDITVTGGPTTVHYFWRAHPGWDYDETPRTLKFDSPGTKRTAGFYGGWGGAGSTTTYWAQLIVTAPVSWQSEQITWATTCTA